MWNRKYLNITDHELEIEHSNEDNIENTTGIVLDVVIQIDKHTYRSNWAIVNCRYDVILGTPWHMDNNVITNYQDMSAKVNGRSLPIPKKANCGPKLTNIGVKKFRWLIRKNSHKTDFVVYRLTQVNKVMPQPNNEIPPFLRKLRSGNAF